jgi:uncharacterized membrane protein YedE/YeeE
MGAIASSKTTFKQFIEWKYKRVFGAKGWSLLTAGLLIGLVNIISYVWVGKAFTVYTGFLNWGQHIYSLIGFRGVVGEPKALPLLEPTSVGDIGAILGAMLAALLSNEFAIRKPSSLLDILESIIGGTLMALGVSLAFGCNWGGFLSAITSWSLHGFAFLIGAILGGYLGLRYVTLRAERITLRLVWPAQPDGVFTQIVDRRNYDGRLSRLLSLTVAVILLALLAAYYAVIGSPMIGGLFVGMAIGIILQRARFCFVTAFRDLFNGPENTRALGIQKGIIVAIISGSIGVFALKYMGIVKEGAGVAPVYVTNVLGGLIFTFGAVLAGGCASGLLWRMGEGHVKAWIALLTTVLAYPLFYSLLRPYFSGYPAVFLPGTIGWIPALVAMIVFAAAYAAFVYYLEYRYKMQSTS